MNKKETAQAQAVIDSVTQGTGKFAPLKAVFPQEACAHQLADGVCGQPIEMDAESYSGYKHSHGRGVDWLHWASPTPHGEGLKETNRIFVPCIVCGKRGPDNEAHIKFKGHKFVAH